MKSWMRLSLLLLLSMSWIGGCQCMTHPSASGSPDLGVTFAFEERQTVTHAGVSTRDPAGGWRTLWSIKGKERIAALQYGEVRRKLTTVVAAEKLERGRIYQFSVDTDGGWLASCVGHVRFTVTSDGSIRECSDDACTEPKL